MPLAPNSPCALCGTLTDLGTYCKDHKPSPARLSSSARGYDSDWRKWRLWFLNRHPICEDCRIKPSTEPHHVKKLRDYPHLRLVESNCIALCHECHSIRSARGE